MEKSRAEDYPRSIKIVTIADVQSCGNRYFLRAVPPEDMLEAKEIYTELVFRFSDSVAVGDRKIIKIGVASDAPGFFEDPPEEAKYIVRDFPAVGTLLHVSLDLTPYLISKTGDNWIEVVFDETLAGFGSFGTFKLWKVELVHTTEGVRSKTA